MVSLRSFFLFLCIFACFFISSSLAYNTFYVGGKDGWVLRPSESYSHWSGRLRFQIGDTLLFKYNNKSDSVLQVHKKDYSNCHTKNPIKRMTSGSSLFQFNNSGPFFFISGHKDHCEKGQKLGIVVLSPRLPHPIPPSSQPPPSHNPPTSPSPTSLPPYSSPTPYQSPSSSPSSPSTPTPYQSPSSSPSSPSTPSTSPHISPHVSPSPSLSPSNPPYTSPSPSVPPSKEPYISPSPYAPSNAPYTSPSPSISPSKEPYISPSSSHAPSNPPSTSPVPTSNPPTISPPSPTPEQPPSKGTPTPAHVIAPAPPPSASVVVSPSSAMFYLFALLVSVSFWLLSY